MARILCAWELGAGLGHIRPLAALGRALRDGGDEAVLALANLGQASAMAAPFRWYQAPLLKLAPNPKQAPLSATDVLAQVGFADGEQLAQVLRAWLALFRLEQPRAVVCDSAPAALLAARIAGLPRIGFGNGFTSPPRTDPMPAMRPWLPSDPQALAEIDAGVLAAVNRALAIVGAQPLPRASALFETDCDLFRTFEPLDPFGPRAGEYIGPLDDTRGGLAVDWLGREGPRFLAYLRPEYPYRRDVTTALAAVPGESIVAIPGLAEPEALSLSSSRVRVFAQAVDLERLIDAADVVVGHGGAGLSAQALRAGKPQALLPMQLEQLLTASRIAALGAASFVEGAPASLAYWLGELAGNAAFREAASRIAAPIAGHSSRAAAAHAAARVAALARG